jgi:large subunit ribosomal protein L31
MKPNIHPQFNMTATVACACGVKFVTGSTATELHTEICSACHPFYTGKQKLLDTAGVVDKFKKRTATATQIKSVVKVKKERKARTTKK